MIAELRTEEQAKQKGWPCYMCVNSNRIVGDKKTEWRNGFCEKCRKENANSKPSKFYLKKSALAGVV